MGSTQDIEQVGVAPDPVRHDSTVAIRTYDDEQGEHYVVTIDGQASETTGDLRDAESIVASIKEQIRACALVVGLRELADYLEASATSWAPWRDLTVSRHLNDAAEFHAAVARHDLKMRDGAVSTYVVAERHFTGAVSLSVQTSRDTIREAELAEREQRLAEREREVAVAEHLERLETDPDYRAEVSYREAGGRDPQGPSA